MQYHYILLHCVNELDIQHVIQCDFGSRDLSILAPENKLNLILGPSYSCNFSYFEI